MNDIDEDTLKKVLSERVKFYREKNQELTAEEANISKDTISKIERGITIPNTLTLLKVCQVLKITPNQLLEGLFETKDNYKSHTDKSEDFVKEIKQIIKKYRIS